MEESFASLVTAMRRLSERLSGQPLPPISRAPQKAPAPPPPPEVTPVVEQPVACAVIGCRQPVRTLGYCSAHYQKRRLMVSTGRLHAAWVEHATPNSIPDVILSRRRRSTSEAPAAQPAASTPAPAPAGPRVWVRKKGQAQAVGASGEEGGPSLPTLPPALRPSNSADVGDTVKRWAEEFLANKRRN
ncbi:cell wall protein [Myxococcus stipitatus]|uniref:cell wall protein n=1 Tax=Myxococcus stipitatus TaxID=83455 RepID=UPI0031452EC0